MDPDDLLTAYLDRVGVDRPPPTADGLRTLVAGHNRSIPFENLDPLTGRAVVDLSTGALVDKLVRQRRGGYCYEHNTLLADVLRALGYEVDLLTGRVGWMRDPSAPTPPRTHLVLAVRVPGEDGRWLVDVGFGGQTLSSPVRLEPGPAQRTRHEPYRLVPHGEWLALESQVRGEWRHLYAFDLTPQERVDLEVGSWFVSTHPSSHFTQGLRVARVRDDARVNLADDSLAVHRVDGTTERRTLPGVDAVLRELEETFGIDVSGVPELPDVLARVLQPDVSRPVPRLSAAGA